MVPLKEQILRAEHPDRRISDDLFAAAIQAYEDAENQDPRIVAVVPFDLTTSIDQPCKLYSLYHKSRKRISDS